MFLPCWVPPITTVLTSVYRLTKARPTVSRHHQELSGDIYSQADFDTANMLLDECDWDKLLSGDVDHIMWATWKENFMMVIHQCIPTAKLSAKPNLPWLNHEITKGMRERNLAFRRVKRTGRSNHLNDYKKKRNKVANMIKIAKAKFFMGLNLSNPKSFWKVTKYLTKQTSSIPILKDCDGNAIHDDVSA